jgi:hypothetical protein
LFDREERHLPPPLQVTPPPFARSPPPPSSPADTCASARAASSTSTSAPCAARPSTPTSWCRTPTRGVWVATAAGRESCWGQRESSGGVTAASLLPSWEMWIVYSAEGRGGGEGGGAKENSISHHDPCPLPRWSADAAPESSSLKLPESFIVRRRRAGIGSEVRSLLNN